MERKKKQTYCLVCRDYTKSINPKIVRNRQNRYIIQSNCATCEKARFIKEEKALGILSNLGINAVADLTVNNSSFFKYKVSLLGNPVLDGNITKRSVKVVVPLKYLSNFFRSLEMPLINCKIKLNLTWEKECVLSNQAGDALFIINDTKMYVPVVTLSKEDNKDFIEQQNKGFQRSIY